MIIMEFGYVLFLIAFRTGYCLDFSSNIQSKENVLFDVNYDNMTSTADLDDFAGAFPFRVLSFVDQYEYAPSTQQPDVLLLTDITSITALTSNTESCKIPFQFNSVDNYFCVKNPSQGDQIQCETVTSGPNLADCFLGRFMMVSPRPVQISNQFVFSMVFFQLIELTEGVVYVLDFNYLINFDSCDPDTMHMKVILYDDISFAEILFDSKDPAVSQAMKFDQWNNHRECFQVFQRSYKLGINATNLCDNSNIFFAIDQTIIREANVDEALDIDACKDIRVSTPAYSPTAVTTNEPLTTADFSQVGPEYVNFTIFAGEIAYFSPIIVTTAQSNGNLFRVGIHNIKNEYDFTAFEQEAKQFLLKYTNIGKSIYNVEVKFYTGEDSTTIKMDVKFLIFAPNEFYSLDEIKNMMFAFRNSLSTFTLPDKLDLSVNINSNILVNGNSSDGNYIIIGVDCPIENIDCFEKIEIVTTAITNEMTSNTHETNSIANIFTQTREISEDYSKNTDFKETNTRITDITSTNNTPEGQTETNAGTIESTVTNTKPEEKTETNTLNIQTTLTNSGSIESTLTNTNTAEQTGTNTGTIQTTLTNAGTIESTGTNTGNKESTALNTKQTAQTETNTGTIEYTLTNTNSAAQTETNAGTMESTGTNTKPADKTETNTINIQTTGNIESTVQTAQTETNTGAIQTTTLLVTNTNEKPTITDKFTQTSKNTDDYSRTTDMKETVTNTKPADKTETNTENIQTTVTNTGTLQSTETKTFESTVTNTKPVGQTETNTGTVQSTVTNTETIETSSSITITVTQNTDIYTPIELISTDFYSTFISTTRGPSEIILGNKFSNYSINGVDVVEFSSDDDLFICENQTSEFNFSSFDIQISEFFINYQNIGRFIQNLEFSNRKNLNKTYFSLKFLLNAFEYIPLREIVRLLDDFRFNASKSCQRSLNINAYLGDFYVNAAAFDGRCSLEAKDCPISNYKPCFKRICGNREKSAYKVIFPIVMFSLAGLILLGALIVIIYNLYYVPKIHQLKFTINPEKELNTQF